MVAKTIIAMQRIAGYGADKIENPESGYSIKPMGDGHYLMTNPEGRHYVVVPEKSNGASHCRCEFHTENRKAYGKATCCKHTIAAKRWEDDNQRIIALEEENERREQYRFDADPFH